MRCPNCDAVMDPWDDCPECGHRDVNDCECNFCEGLRKADDPSADTRER